MWFGDSKRGRIGSFFGNDPTLGGYWQLQDLQDNSGNGSALTVSGTISAISRFGLGRQNTASSDHMTATNNSAISTNIANANQLTAMFWVKFPSTLSSGFPIFCHGRDNASTAGYQIGWNFFVANALAWTLTYDTTNQANCAESPANNFQPNIWYLIAFTWDGSTMSIYRNGLLTGTNALGSHTITPQTFDLDFYDRRNTGGTFASGGFANITLAEVAIFSRCLNASQISQYYAWATKKKAPRWSRVFNPFQILSRTMTDSILNGASRTASITRLGAFVRTMSDSITNGASRSATLVKGLAASMSDSIMNGAGRLASVIKGLGKALSDSIMNGASRSATVSRMATFMRPMSDTIMNAASRFATVTKGFVRTMSDSMMNAKGRLTIMKAYVNGLLIQFKNKYTTQGTSYSSKYNTQGTDYEQKYQ